MWRELAAEPPHHPSSIPSPAADPALEASRLQVYGALASSAAASSANGANPADAPRPANHVHAAIDHIVAMPDAPPQHFLHRRFSVRGYQGFSFVVPPHASHPCLQGTYKSSAQGNADVEVLLLNQQEFSDFVHGQAGTATYSNDPSTGGQVNWILNSPLSQPQKYYLIFRNSPGGPRLKLVDADFTISFE